MTAHPPTPAADVSVIIPVGGVGPELEQELRAVMGQQTSLTFDVVLSLNTPDVAATAQLDQMLAALSEETDIDFRVVPSHDKRGAAHARNIGAAATEARILAFCDADDVVEDGWLASLVGGLGEHSAVSGFVSDDKFMPEGQRDWRPETSPGGLPSFLGHPYLLSGNLAIERAAFEAVGGFDTTLTRCEDIAISWALVDKGYTIGFVPEAVLHYRHREGLWPMLRQHYLYGRGMSEVLVRQGVPASDDEAGSSKTLFKANNQRTATRNFPSVMRRASIAAGRLHGLVATRLTG